MNFVRDVLGGLDPQRPAIVVDGGDTWDFGDLLARAGSVAGGLASHGVGRGSVVLSLVGNTIEYPLLMLACHWIGAALLPCSEQLRAKDVALRVSRAEPALIVADPRNAAAVSGLDVLFELPSGPAPAYASLADDDPSFVLFTSGTSGEPKLVRHGQRYLTGQRLQATSWLAAEAGELVWSTASPGWSKSARNAFLAPWLCGATALLQDARFTPAGRLDTIRRHGVNVLCMAPTEYRLIAADGEIGSLPSLRRAVTAGEALGVPAFEAWRAQTGLSISDGYGQTETGQVTGVRPGETAPPGSMGRFLPGVRGSIVDGELCLDPSTLPTLCLGFDGPLWHTGDQVRQDGDGWLFFESRADDVIISSGYRIGPAEVESTLLGHPAVRECAVLGLPDDARGSIVGAAVVLQPSHSASDELVGELQAHVRAETALYKYPRRIWFVDELPKTTSGKIARREISPPPRHPHP